MKATLDALRAGLVAVIRTDDPQTALKAGLRAAGEGACAVEVTWTTPDAHTVVRELVAQGVRCGAGTILDETDAAQAAEAGAEFLVAPVNPPFLVPFSLSAGLLPVPGAATPSEIWSASHSGAPMVKVFPAARLGGPAFLRDLLAPMPTLLLMCTGGITRDSADDYLRAGAYCVGLSRLGTVVT